MAGPLACPTNLTNLPAQQGTLVEQTDFTTVRDSINAELTRRSIGNTSWTGYSDPILAALFNEMRDSIATNLGTTTPTTSVPIQATVSAGDMMTAAQIETLESNLDEWKVLCVCNCNFCPCNCDFCPCNCDFCPCNCDFCPCNCNFCPCNCNFCPCNCNFCPCNCNFCPCNCNFCPCNCNFCPCNCNFCPCNCNFGPK